MDFEKALRILAELSKSEDLTEEEQLALVLVLGTIKKRKAV